jgi:hypothetical protein
MVLPVFFFYLNILAIVVDIIIVYAAARIALNIHLFGKEFNS